MQAVRQACPQPVWAATTGMEKWGDLVKGQAAKPPVVPCFVCLSDAGLYKFLSLSPSPFQGGETLCKWGLRVAGGKGEMRI